MSDTQCKVPYFLMLPLSYDAKKDRWLSLTINVAQIATAVPVLRDEEREPEHLDRRTTIYLAHGGSYNVQVPYEYLAATLQFLSDGHYDQAEENLSDFQDEYLSKYHPKSRMLPQTAEPDEDEETELEPAEVEPSLPWYDEVRDFIKVPMGAQGLVSYDDDFDDYDPEN